jgi:hypothetical protein
MSGFIFTLLKENKYPLKNQRLKSNTYAIPKEENKQSSDIREI